MTSLPNLEQFTELTDFERDLVRQLGNVAEKAEPAEFEIVLGRRQIAGTALLAMVLLVVFCGLAYSIGKSMMAENLASVLPAQPMPSARAVNPAPALPAGRLPAEQAPIAPIRTTTAPLFGAVIPGQVYLQTGIIAKGSAATWAEGLRGHGLDAFVAPGPDDGLGMWRILVGPLPDPKVYQQAKNILDALGVPNFARTF
jgi:hypothetical protein